MFATVQVTLCEISTFTLLLFVRVFRMPLANSTAFCLESSVPADSSRLKPLFIIFMVGVEGFEPPKPKGNGFATQNRFELLFASF